MIHSLTHAALAATTNNYRYYIGTGSRHTMYGSNKVYTDQTGGEAQTIVDWIRDMIAFGMCPGRDLIPKVSAAARIRRSLSSSSK